MALGKKLYTSLEQLQLDLDGWMREYNEERAHSGKYCFGKTPWQTFRDAAPLAQEKMLDRLTATPPSDTVPQRAEPQPERSHAERRADRASPLRNYELCLINSPLEQLMRLVQHRFSRMLQAAA